MKLKHFVFMLLFIIMGLKSYGDINGNNLNVMVIPRLCRGDYKSLTVTGV
jgi:hypothetical protein